MSDVSWLTLEAYACGELDALRAAELEAVLKARPEVRARLDAILGDMRPLPALDLGSLAPDSGVGLPKREPQSLRLGWAVVLAVAAAALIVAGIQPATPPGQSASYKGGTLSIAVDRQRTGATLADPQSYADGDRIRVRLSCPPGERDWTVAVTQGGLTVFPLPQTGPLVCANHVVLPGGFELTGPGTVRVCAGVDAGAARLRAGSMGEGVVCLELRDE